VTAVAAGLEAARAAEIVHRDLKPQNVFLTDGGTWKVLDFGVSKLGGATATLTQGQIVGTPGYMAPEQVEGGEVDHRADVFALAGITYRALTGRRAFPGEDARAVMMDVLLRQPAAPSSFSAFPPDVEAVLALGLAKHAPDRMERAVEFAEALRVAMTHELSPRLRERAAAVLKRHPWGARSGHGNPGRAASVPDLG
jgi:eukaryotic-like serine/threonine-protein kinase